MIFENDTTIENTISSMKAEPQDGECVFHKLLS